MANKLTKLTNEDKNRVLSGTSYVLPNNPSNKGWTADQIRQKGYQGLIAMFDLINTKFQAIIDDLNERVLNNDFGEFQTEITNNLNQINSSFSTINTDITNLKKGVSTNKIAIKNNYNELIAKINDLYLKISQVSTDTFPTRDEVNARFSRLSDLIRDAVEIAEGKNKTFVLSYEFTIPSDEELSTSLNYYDGEGNTIKSSQDILNYLGDGWSLNDLVNSNFNSQENSIGLVSENSSGTRGFICVEVEGKRIFSKVADNDKQFPLFKTGDIILVKETNVPDRWYTYNVAYKMETTKVDLSTVVHKTGDETITGIKNFTNGIKVGNSPITFSNNELQVANDIVGAEGNNLGSQAQPFNKLYAKYFNDGSGTETMLSELTNGIIKEINTQYIRIWDLDVGIYKLTYNGTKYIYYKGKTNNDYAYINATYVKSALLFVYSESSDYLFWYLRYEAGNTDANFNPLVYEGVTSETTGRYWSSFMFSPLGNGVNGRTILNKPIYVPTTAGSSGQVLVSTGDEPSWSSDIPTKSYVDNAIQTAIGNVLNGDF